MDQVTDWNFSNGEERHFALVDGFAFSNPGSLVISQVGNSVRPMHLFGRQRPIMITTSNSSVKRSGTPNQYARCSTAHHGDFRAVPRANRILSTAGNPIPDA